MLVTIGIVAQGSGFLPAGTLISTFCESTSGNDAGGTYYTGAWNYSGVYADGVGGTYTGIIGENTNGCYYPSGFYNSYSESLSSISWTNSRSGESGDYTWYGSYSWTVSDGSGGSSSGGTGIQFGYYGTIINSYFDPSDGYNYIVAFDPNGGGSGSPSYYEYTEYGSGSLISTQCVATSGYDYNGNYWSGSWDYEETYSDGMGGFYSNIVGSNINGCWYPSGWVFSSSGGDLSIEWSHGGNSGTFVYGNNSQNTFSDGAGGSYSDGGTVISATDNQVVNSYTNLDSATGYTIHYTLYFRASDNTLQTGEFIEAGTLLSEYCGTKPSTTDARGVTYYDLPAKVYQYADGIGGSYYSYNIDDGSCGGYTPAGFFYTYEVYYFTLSYLDQYGSGASWNYGEEGRGDAADGTGNGYGYPTVAYTTIAPSGTVFYLYYDSAGNQYVNYVFDGVDSYTIVYSEYPLI